ncbi:MAG: asparagine synthetase B [Lachnospiraceae bacterium]|nr:asparagine synthetase B [Lachnospiraceae bacterium]
MSGIAGIYQPYAEPDAQRILERMVHSLHHRGPDGSGIWETPQGGLAQTCRAVIRRNAGGPPIVKGRQEAPAAITLDGELYNAEELLAELRSIGCSFETESDAEIILTGYLEYGPDFVRQLNGVFAFAILDQAAGRLLLCRDRIGAKPLFYTFHSPGGTVSPEPKSAVLPDCRELVFASEIKGIFAHPEIKPELTRQSLQEIFVLGPARIPGSGVFRHIRELLPGHMLLYSADGCQDMGYWTLESLPHADSPEDTIEKTAFLVQDAIRRQSASDAPLCSLLSGGLDSSLVSAVCAGEQKKKGKPLHTISFEFAGNEQSFTANPFQPSLDGPYADQMVSFLGSRHHVFQCSSQTLADCLSDSVLAHDLPAMADVDASLLHFCSMVSRTKPEDRFGSSDSFSDRSAGGCGFRTALTGECADEIFGGYPWFFKKDCLSCRAFPWSMDLSPRKALLKEDFIQELQMEEFSQKVYEEAVSRTPLLPGEGPLLQQRREMAWLNLTWFMQTLLNRMDRAAMRSGLTARVPFADYRIIEYLWNVPWEQKASGNIPKNLLRQAAKGLLPDAIRCRRKSPYPKTYDKAYEAILSDRIRELLTDSHAPIRDYLDKQKVEAFLNSPSDYGAPWYGQLMAGPQLLAYIWQVNFWMESFQLSGTAKDS